MNLNKLANLRPRQIDVIAVAIMVAMASGLALPRINPLLRSSSFVDQQRDQLAVALRNEKDLGAFLTEQRKRLAEIQASVRTQKIHLESAKNINRRIARLTNLAAGTGLNVNEILPGSAVAGARFDSVPVRVNATGSYPTCVAFLCKLTEAFPDTSVGSFELTGNPQRPEGPAEFHVDLIWHATADDGRRPKGH